MKKRVADIIMDLLVDAGITDSFSVVGGGSMHLDNALGKKKEIQKVFNHHEQACAMAAEAYAKIEGKIPLVLVTSGPGATNTLTGVMGAWVDSLPMLILSGQVRYDLTVAKTGLNLRFRGGQEFNIVDTVKTMTKYSKMIIDPLSIKYELLKAIDIATSGRRGPVWLDIPLDVQMAEIDVEKLYPAEKIQMDTINEQDINDIMDGLKNAKRPILLVGNGVGNSGAIPAFRSLSRILDVPYLAAAQASDVGFREDPNYYGIAGIVGWRAANFIVQNSDFIVSLGSSLGFKTTGYAQEYFAPNAKIFMIDADENESLKPGLKIDKFIHADVNNLLKIWNEIGYKIKVDASWKQYCENVKNKFDIFEATHNLDMNERVCSYYFWKKYDEQASDNNISILGNNTGISAKVSNRCFKKRRKEP